MQVAPVPRAHYCGECCAYYEGEMNSWEALAEDYSQGTSMEEVEVYTIYECGDPNGPCTLVDGDFHYVDDVWKCGECGEIFTEIADALDCCQ